MELKIRMCLVNSHFGGSMNAEFLVEFPTIPEPAAIKDALVKKGFRPNSWKLLNADVVEILNKEEVKNPATFIIQNNVMVAF